MYNTCIYVMAQLWLEVQRLWYNQMHVFIVDNRLRNRVLPWNFDGQFNDFLQIIGMNAVIVKVVQ